MFKLIAATLAALYAVLMIFGDPDAAPTVARASSADADQSRFSFSELLQPDTTAAAVTVSTLSGPTEKDAIKIAMQTADDLRAERQDGTALRGIVAAIEKSPNAAEMAAATDADTWYVTGNTVNLRQGPSTSDAVVGQVSLGDAATTLTDTAADWIQIRTAGGQTGWIFSRFLDANRPG